VIVDVGPGVASGDYSGRRPLVWRYPAQLPQGRKAARVSGLWRVHGGSPAIGYRARRSRMSLALYRKYRPAPHDPGAARTLVSGPRAASIL